MGSFNIEKTDSQCVVTWQYLVGGKTRLVLNENGLESLSAGCFSDVKHRVSLADIRLFRQETRSHGKARTQRFLQAVCQGKNKNIDYYASSAKGKEIDAVCEQLNAFLVKLKTEGVSTKWEGISEPIALEINSSPQHLEPPPKSRWHYQSDYEGFGFRKRGGDNVEDFFGPLGCAVFIGGFVAIIGFLRGEWDSVFLILVGLVILYHVVLALIGLIELLFRRTSWTFAFGEARFCSVLFVLARTANYELTDWKSLVVHIPEAERNHTKELELDCNAETVRDYYSDSALWQLAFLNTAGEQLMAIEKLRKPEALWMADVVLREQRTIR
jgi:hypothetical protein